MPSLQTVGRRFENEMVRADGFPFKATVIPQKDDPGVSYDFSEPRISIRVRHDSVVNVGDIVLDPAGRRYLLATHDEPSIQNQILYRTHLAYPINKTVAWERPSGGVKDPLTGLSKGGGRDKIADIEVLIEMFGREDMDFAIKVREQTRRLITAAPVQLNDIVDNMIVKRVDKQLGIWVAEIE